MKTKVIGFICKNAIRTGVIVVVSYAESGTKNTSGCGLVSTQKLFTKRIYLINLSLCKMQEQPENQFLQACGSYLRTLTMGHCPHTSAIAAID